MFNFVREVFYKSLHHGAKPNFDGPGYVEYDLLTIRLRLLELIRYLKMFVRKYNVMGL